MELSSANYEAQLFWADVEYIFISSTPALMLAFALIYVGRGSQLSRPVVWHCSLNLRSPYLYRLQAAAVVIGIMAPWVANAAYVMHWGGDDISSPAPCLGRGVGTGNSTYPG